MAISSDDAVKHTDKADTLQLQQAWAVRVYQALLQKRSEEEAIKQATQYVEQIHSMMHREPTPSQPPAPKHKAAPERRTK